MIATLLVIFIVGYILIASEHVLHVNKATFALIMCGLLWAIYAVCSHDPNISHEMVLALGDTCEIVVFLIGAMTIVELIDRYGGFQMLVEKIHASNKRSLMWILAVVAFFLSAVLDNMTTTIIMVMMLRRMLTDQKERWIFACVIVLAANAGGAWSPIGDITTIMLWMKNYVSSVDLIVNLLLPSMVSVIVPVFIASRMVPATAVEPLNENDQRKGYRLYDHHPQLSVLILCCGV
ncbi:MAG: sodium:proton antiporter NhaD, partial [Muribaculaceae bacterium]|nr:sodium:proton antiporter NhaD [Muribaculaceae bacterium]